MELYTHTENQRPTMQHMAQLDTLRAFAVIGVLATHYMPTFRSAGYYAMVSVRFFFVLSGFLITSILLKSRSVMESGKQSPRSTLYRFYIRRFLRIFPLYYFVLAVTAIADVTNVRETLPWNVTYLSNVYFFTRRHWAGPVSHFWSLAVEEQFYLVWPWLILFTPRRFLMRLIICLIIIGPLFRIWLSFNGHDEFYSVLPFSCLDVLGMGALLAVCREEKPISPEKFNRLLTASLWVGLLLIATVIITDIFAIAMQFRGTTLTIAEALICSWLVARAAQGFKGRWRSVMEWKPFLYLGTISYGVYVYHLFMPFVLGPWFQSHGVPVQQIPVINFLTMSVVTIIISALSWHFFENPINKLKDHFKFREEQADNLAGKPSVVGREVPGELIG